MSSSSDSDSEWSSDSESGDLYASAFPLFNDIVTPPTIPTSLQESLKQDCDNGFDLLAILHTKIFPTLQKHIMHPLQDDYVLIRLINNLREDPSNPASCLAPLPAPADYDVDTNGPVLPSGEIYAFQQSKYFKPLLEDDGYIASLDALREAYESRFDLKASRDDEDDEVEQVETVEVLKAKLLAAQKLIKDLTTRSSLPSPPPSKPQKNTSSYIPPPSVDSDSYYFNSYSHSSIHHTMLSDVHRTQSYKTSILTNPSIFKNKNVLDVGCGTGILSHFALKAGSRCVVGVDDSNMLRHAVKVSKNLNIGEELIFIRGKIEEVVIPEEVEQFDVIVSEWMGYGLLYETMLPSVIYAREKYLREGGTMWPNKCEMFMELGSDTRTTFWDDVYGIDMSPMKAVVEAERYLEASVEIVKPEIIVSGRHMFWEADLNKVKDEELDFVRPFEIKAVKKTSVNCLVVTFDCDFDLSSPSPVKLTTSVQTEATHWQHVVLWLEPTRLPALEGGESFRGNVKVERKKDNHRDIEFTVEWEGGGLKGKQKWGIVS
ncbi:hypothetical protein TrVE_jg2705 [Triparma verrucosa]|uniref:type I protein arginine methyltransferase n=1 Tax=Triparma verrucosa TaxID=1606542 RepID=A0A9W7FLB4_9STRA|nr:hypothetical protein TrVE_jg2705 [Triparma verrucosa]